MKNVFLGFGITICAIISIVIVMTLCGTNMRQNELNRAVDSALPVSYTHLTLPTILLV